MARMRDPTAGAAPQAPPAPSGAAAMEEPAGPYHLLQCGLDRYLCYCRPGPGPGGTVYVTDALEVWAGELGACPPLGCRCQPEEHGAKLREALGRGAVALSMGPGKAPATLQLREKEEEEEAASRCSALDLFKLPAAGARSQLQALVFGMAGRVGSLERRLEAVEMLVSSRSPEKNITLSQQHFLPDPSPRKNRETGSALLAKRKIPGESLINPGFKSKKAPSGVDFEDS